MTETCYLSIAELGRAYTDRLLSPVEVTQAVLRRIERLDGQLHTYITVTADEALQAASASERRFARGDALGPLDGVPIGLKDLYDTAGVRTTAHSPLFAERIPATDAAAVRRIHDAGAVPLGKHAMYEFALGKVELDGIFPPARNPWNPEMIPGGSSSGSAAAVAAGLCAGALGSDTGGSIRWPSSFCGIVGLKPTYGLISRAGVIPLAWTLDHTGPMARTVEDVALLLQVAAGHDPRDPGSAHREVPHYASKIEAGVTGLRVGAPLSYVERADGLREETYVAYRAALGTLERLGATVENIELPADVEHAPAVNVTIMVTEALALHQRDARERPELFGRRFYGRLLEAALLTGADYVQALRGRALICRAMSRAMRTVDLIVMPTNLRPAWRFEEDDLVPPQHRVRFTQLFNITGQPAVSVPCGFSTEGLPIGLQIAARPFEDHLALAAAHAYERAAGWTSRRPSLDVEN